MEPSNKGTEQKHLRCFARTDKKHCSHYELEGICCDCMSHPADMCQRGCGQFQVQHDASKCVPMVKDEDLYLDLVSHLRRQRAFSHETFGPPGQGQSPLGVIDHLERELRDELRKDPTNLKEWIDVMILGFDGALKSGHTPEDITRALVAKQSKNERRDWPNWRTMPKDGAIEHVRTELKQGEDQKYYCISCNTPFGDGHLSNCEYA